MKGYQFDAGPSFFAGLSGLLIVGLIGAIIVLPIGSLAAKGTCVGHVLAVLPCEKCKFLLFR